LYTYCRNNPNIYVDSSGHFWSELWDGIKAVASEALELGKSAVKETGKEMSKSAGTYAFAAAVTQVDSPAIGLGDLVGGSIAGKEFLKNVAKGAGKVIFTKIASDVAKNLTKDIIKSKLEKDVNQKKTLYHYTNSSGLVGILSDMAIKPSLKSNNSKDALYGEGQYLSDLNPAQYTATQLALNFLHVPNPYKYTNYVEIDVTGLDVVECRNHVYLIPNDEPLDITGRIISAGVIGTKEDD